MTFVQLDVIIQSHPRHEHPTNIAIQHHVDLTPHIRRNPKPDLPPKRK